MGGQNFHLDIIFADGITWIARIQLNEPYMAPLSIRKQVFLSEVATLKFLEQTAVPSPKVFYYALASDEKKKNPVGVSFMLQEKLAGAPLDWHWATETQRAKIADQLADIYLELEKYPLNMTGSPILTDGLVSDDLASQVGPYTELQLFASPTDPLGPFTSSITAYKSMFKRQIDLLVMRQFTSLPVDHYLAFRWRLEIISTLASSISDTVPFCLKHPDDKGDHLLVDENYNITAIIDWESTSAEVKEFAFTSPCMMWDISTLR